jgi:uncharacterized protein YeaO (DUF488 family)
LKEIWILEHIGRVWRIMIRTKRVYEPAEPNDETRVLVDRLWPRGIRKEQLILDAWYKEAAPSRRLRLWFGHDPARWDEFRKRYFAELDSNPEAWRSLVELARSGNVTLLYSAKNEENNNAAALKDYLESKLQE